MVVQAPEIVRRFKRCHLQTNTNKNIDLRIIVNWLNYKLENIGLEKGFFQY